MAHSQHGEGGGCKCCRRCGECLIISLNVIAIIISLIVVAFGAALLCFTQIAQTVIPDLQFSFSGYTTSLTPIVSQAQTMIFNPIGIGFVVVGSVLFIFSILGCCAAIKKKFCCMVIYGLFLFLVAAALIVTVILFATNQGWLSSFVTTTLQEQLVTKYYVDVPVFQNMSQYSIMQNAVGIGMNLLMYTESCCGAASYTDMQKSSAWSTTYVFNASSTSITCSNAVIPPVCCLQSNVTTNSYSATAATALCNCIQVPTAQNSYMNTPCSTPINNLMNSYVYGTQYYGAIVGVWAGFGGLIFLFFVYSIVLMVQYKKRQRRHREERDEYDGNQHNSRALAGRGKYDRPYVEPTAIPQAATNFGYLAAPEPTAPPAYTAPSTNFGIYAPATSGNPGAYQPGPYQLPRF